MDFRKMVYQNRQDRAVHIRAGTGRHPPVAAEKQKSRGSDFLKAAASCVMMLLLVRRLFFFCRRAEDSEFI